MSAVVPLLDELTGSASIQTDICLCLPGMRVAELASRAAILEAATSPKPGLVCIDGNGAHSDMDYPLFVRSAKALRPYFAKAHALGWATYRLAPAQAFARLRPLGIRAEQCMLQATSGVNTHKGLIFSMGLFCAVVGRLSRSMSEQGVSEARVRSEAALLVRGLVQRDFAHLAEERKVLSGSLRMQLLLPVGLGASLQRVPRAVRPALEARLQRKLTAGEVLYLLYGITGIRGEAEQGFPHVGLGLQALEAHGAGRDLNTAMVHCLLELMQSMDDTNILWRGGAHGLYHAAGAARSALAAGGLCTPAGQEALRRMSVDFAQRRLSPGGCADMLAVSVFLHLLRLHGRG